MKSIGCKMLLFCLVACFACGFCSCAPDSTDSALQKIDGQLPQLESVATNPYGTAPDIDGVIIDGELSDSIWQGALWAEYDMAVTKTTAKCYAYGFISNNGVYFALKIEDKSVFWHKRVDRTVNTNVNLDFYGKQTGLNKRTVSIRFDAKDIYPARIPVNARFTFSGNLNEAGKTDGFTYESFMSFEELGFDSAPEKMQVKITYAFKWYKLTKLESRAVTYEIGKRA